MGEETKHTPEWRLVIRLFCLTLSNCQSKPVTQDEKRTANDE